MYWSPEREDKSIIWNDSVYSIRNQLLHIEHMNKLIGPGCYNLLGEDQDWCRDSFIGNYAENYIPPRL